jgi:Flp pilus assembly pilin Flp
MRRLTTLLHRLRRDRRGVAMLEFGFIAPVLLILMVYGLECANMAMTLLRVYQTAATTADNAARVRDAITEGDINEVLAGGGIVGGNKPAATDANQRTTFTRNGRIVLSAVTRNEFPTTDSRNGYTIVWQRCTGQLNTTQSQPAYGAEGKGKTDASLQRMGTTTRNVQPIPGSVAIYAEVSYRYQPLFSAAVLGTPVLRSEASFTVRERPSEALDTATASNVRTCSRYDL